ncbi:hypothetical protein OS493_008258 [Desmophyllum pertusum]|uniref:Uncharacterized protein n=1 Tax=Desmophyllum pertusum TaxID=174260 RepID=A0A9X0A4P3_9CNID|nr:hypothetical protein OS493_008258 [Desmophyllum pertusum]
MERLFFDPETNTLVSRAPGIEEFTQNPANYPGYVLLMKNDTGKLHVMTVAEAQRITDKQIITGMPADGFFQTLITQVIFTDWITEIYYNDFNGKDRYRAKPELI